MYISYMYVSSIDIISHFDYSLLIEFCFLYSMNEGEMTIPHLFRCPISLDLFEDPVTLCTGQTYDRSSIEKWLSQGNLTCPVTMQKLHDLSIVPNHTLRHLIIQWLQLNPNSSNILIDHSLLPSLKHTLQSHHSSFQSKLQALQKINLFSHEYFSFNKSCFLHLGFLPLLLDLVFGSQISISNEHSTRGISLSGEYSGQDQISPSNGPDSTERISHQVHSDRYRGQDQISPSNRPDDTREISHQTCSDRYSGQDQICYHNHMEFIDLSLSCILKLLPFDTTSHPLNILTQDPKKFQSFLQLFSKGTTTIKTSLCNLIDSAPSSHSQDLLYFNLGNAHNFLQEIIILLDDDKASMAAIKAISSLSSVESNREKLVSAGAIDGIIRYIISGRDEKKKKKKQMDPLLGMEVIEKLVGVERGKEELVNNPKGIETLVKMVFRVSNIEEYCSENAVGILMIVCRESGRAREEAIGEGVLSQLLLLLQSQCSGRTKTKARMLLKLLRSKWMSENVPKQV